MRLLRIGGCVPASMQCAQDVDIWYYYLPTLLLQLVPCTGLLILHLSVLHNGSGCSASVWRTRFEVSLVRYGKYIFFNSSNWG